MSDADEFRTIGLIVAAHGIRGTVKLMPLTDFPERFQQLERGFLRDQESIREVGIQKISITPRHILIDFECANNRDEAETLRGAELCVRESDTWELPDGTFYISDLRGFTAVDEQGGKIGILNDITRGAQDVLRIDTEPGELLVPFVEAWVGDVNTEAGTIEILNWQSLLDTQSSPSSDDH